MALRHHPLYSPLLNDSPEDAFAFYKNLANKTEDITELYLWLEEFQAQDSDYLGKNSGFWLI